MGDPVTEKIGKAIVPESISSGDVTVVTYRGRFVKLESRFVRLATARDAHFRAIRYPDQQIAAAPARLRHPLAWNAKNLAALHSRWNLDSEKSSTRPFHGFGPTLLSPPRIDPEFATEIGASRLKAKAWQRFQAELNMTALERARARDSKARARRRLRRNLQPVGLDALRICRIVHGYVDRGSPKKVFNSNPNILRDVAVGSRASPGRRGPARLA